MSNSQEYWNDEVYFYSQEKDDDAFDELIERLKKRDKRKKRAPKKMRKDK